MRRPGDRRVVAKPLVLGQVPDVQQIAGTDCGRADRDLARQSGEVGRQTVLRFLPVLGLVDEADHRHWATADLRRQLGDFVVGHFRCSIENLVTPERFQPPALIGGNCEAHVQSSGNGRANRWLLACPRE